MIDRQKALTEQIESLRSLINKATDTAVKKVLEDEKADCLRELMALVSQTQTTPIPQLSTTTLPRATPTQNSQDQQPTDALSTTEITTQNNTQQDLPETQVITQPQPT
ncbi:hypothetical protein, partial [Helicobacter felis]